MFSFFKKKSPVKPYPEWARFDSADQYFAFKSAVEHYFIYDVVQLDFDQGTIKCERFARQGLSVLNMVDLSEHCINRHGTPYGETVSEYLSNLYKRAAADTNLLNFETVKETLGLRILTNRLVETIAKDKYISAALFEDLLSFLVLDTPGTTVNIKQADVAHWELTHQELLQMGKKNIELKYPQTIETFEILDMKIWAVENESFYAPNILMDMKDHPQLIGKHGSLVVVPNGENVFIYPIQDIKVNNAVGKMAAIAFSYYKQKANPITENLYWYYNGCYQHISCNPHKPDFSLLPKRFVNMLRSLDK